MIDAVLNGLLAALGHPGAVPVLGVTFVAGVVYGFSGFGAALIYMPVAVVFLDPPTAVAAFAVAAIISLVTLVPRGWRDCDRVTVSQLIAAALITMPFGLFALRSWDVTLLRWLVLAVAAITLVALMSGWRRSAGNSWPARSAVGAGAGLIGGATGLVGPIVILFQLSSPDGPRRSRANTLVFLTLTSMSALPLMAVQGMLTLPALWLGALQLLPYGAGTLVGQALFQPDKDRLYRAVAYAVIGLAIIIGLPIWEGA